MKKTIHVLVNDIPYESSNDTKVKSGRSPLEKILKGGIKRAVEFEVDVLCEQLKDNIESMVGLFEQIEDSKNKYSVDSISFSLSVTATGKVALLSVLDGTMVQGTGIHITLKK